MKNLKKSQYSLRKSLAKDNQISNTLKPSQSNKTMVRTAKDDKLKAGVKRTRGRPRTKEPKGSSQSKRHKPLNNSSTNGTKSPQREASLSPTHQDPPQLEPMPAVEEDEDVDIPLGYTGLNSVDEHLLPGKCIVICPLSTCRKKYANPIELVSHLRNYHEKEKFSSLKIYTCPTCLKTRFSSHTTSSDLTLLSEHAERYHGQTLSQNEFAYFCTVIMDILTVDKATHKKEECNLIKKEVVAVTQQSNSDILYHSILPTALDFTASSGAHSECNVTKVARVSTDSLGLKMPSQTGHFIQISPLSQHIPSNISATVSCTAATSPYFAALAAVAGQLPSGAFLLSSSSATTTTNAVVPTTTSAEQPILIAPTASICAAPNHPSKPLPVFITSSTTATQPIGSGAEASQSNTLTPTNLQPQSPSAAAAIATLKQLIQSASTAVKSQQSPQPTTVAQVPSPITLTNTSFLSSPQAPSCTTSVTKVVTKLEQPSATPIGYPFSQGATLVSSPGAELETTTDLSSYASANADLLTLARLSVNQATADALNCTNNNTSATTTTTTTITTTTSSTNLSADDSKKIQESHATVTPVLHSPPPPPPPPNQITPSTTPSRNRRLLPRKTAAVSPTQAAMISVNPPTAAAPVPIQKRVTLARLAVKPPKEVALQTPQHTSQPQQTSTSNLDSIGPLSATGASEEAPLMTASLINPSPTTNTLIPSTLNNMLAKSRLLATTTVPTPTSFINMPVRPVISAATALAAAMVPSSSNQTQPQYPQQQHQHVLQRMMPTIRPAPLQKILPRPNVFVASTAATTTTTTSAPVSTHTITVTPNSVTPSAKEIRHPLLYSVGQAPLIAQAPITMITASLASVTATPSPSVLVTSSPSTPIKSAPQVVNGSGGVPASAISSAASAMPTPALTIASNTCVSSDEGHLVICTSPSEMNVPT